MSDPGEQPNPFEGIPLFSELAKMISRQGPLSWDTARQVAHVGATGGTSEPNVGPAVRIRFEQLARVAELHISDRTGLQTSSGGLRIQPVTRGQWVESSLDAWRPLFEQLATSLAAADEADREESDPNDPTAFLAPLMKMAGPMLLGMTAGSLVGELARRSLGTYDVPVPRRPSDEILVIGANIDEFGQEWSLDPNDLALWICLHEVAHHAVLRLPHVRTRLEELLAEYLRRFRPNHGALEEHLGELEMSSPDSMSSLAELLGDPEVLLGAIRSPEQTEMLPHLETLIAAISGFVDWAMDEIGSSLMADYEQITEAVRRRRVEAHSSDRFVEQLFGLQLGARTYEEGSAFVAEVVRRGGDDGLARLWAGRDQLPTPNELQQPGLWLARVGVDTALDDEDLDELTDLEIPDDLSGL